MQTDQITQEAITYIRTLFSGNADGHGADHSLRVWRNAMMIAAGETGCDRLIVSLAALLHDADDHKLFSTENNANARRFLEEHCIPAETADRICAVINSVSFRDGHKFRNSIEQHRELREVSNAVCKEHGLSVLTNAPFYGGQAKGAYWKEQKGQPTHRQQLKEDVEYCLRYSLDWPSFARQLEAKGYELDMTRKTVKAKTWQRGVRLNRLGYTDDVLYERWDRNEADPEFEYRYNDHRPRVSTAGVLMRVVVEMDQTRRARLPLSQAYPEQRPHSKRDNRSPVEKLLNDLIYEANHTHDTATILADAIFAILIALVELATHYTREVVLSAELRHDLKNVVQFHTDYRFLKENGLHSISDLDRDMEQTQEQIAALTEQRSKIRNRVRHETDPAALADNKAERAATTDQIISLRQRTKHLKRIQKDTPRLVNLLKTELQAEFAVKHPVKEQQKQRARSYEQER